MVLDGCSEPINNKYLIIKNGLKHHPETNKLYSGKVFENRMDGKRELEGYYKNGRKNGKWTTWYENGQKKDEEYYKYFDKYGYSVRNGKRITWFENGQMSSEATYKDGKLDGLGFSWYENGRKWYEATYNNGQEDGLATSWYENGQKRYEENYKRGKLIYEKCWDDG